MRTFTYSDEHNDPSAAFQQAVHRAHDALYGDDASLELWATIRSANAPILQNMLIVSQSLVGDAAMTYSVGYNIHTDGIRLRVFSGSNHVLSLREQVVGYYNQQEGDIHITLHGRDTDGTVRVMADGRGYMVEVVRSTPSASVCFEGDYVDQDFLDLIMV